VPANWHYVDQNHIPVLRRIRKRIMQFTANNGISSQNVARLANVLRQLRERGIFVVAFNPPVASEVARAMATDPSQRTLWNTYRPSMVQLFASLDIPFLFLETPATLGLDDRYMFDGIHAEETFHLYILRALLSDARVKNALPQAEGAVDRAIADPRTDFWNASL
jgi:hypothetical protein